MRATGREVADASGAHGEASLAPNTEGLAYVDEGDLITSEGSLAKEMLAKTRNPHVKPD